MNKKMKRRRLFAAILALILAAAMIVPLAMSALGTYGAELDKETVTGEDASDQEDAAEETSADSEVADATEEGSKAVSEAVSEFIRSGEAGWGVYLENTCITGMNAEEIESVAYTKLGEYQSEVIRMYVNGTAVHATAGEMGLYWTNADVVSQAVTIGKKGNIWERYQINQYAKTNGPICLELDFAVDPQAVQSVVEERCCAMNCDPVNTGLTHNADGTFSTIPGQDGISVEVEATTNRIVEYMDNEWNGRVGGVNAVADVVPHEGDESILSLVTDILGQSTTNYDSSATQRCANIANGVSKLNGILLYPGEEISVCDHLVPFTADNGYYLAPSFEMGEVVDSYGGGICQVSTTLYHAVLNAELEVTQRSPHSMVVAYVAPGMDAAIAEGSKDLKFVNSTEYPIYIEGSVGDGTVTFTIYGHETRDPNRVVSYESQVLSTQEQEIEFETSDQVEFGLVKEDEGHIAQTAELCKIVTVNGVEESKEHISFSEYEASPHVYTVGIQGLNESEIALINQAIQTKDLATVTQAILKVNEMKMTREQTATATEMTTEQTGTSADQGTQ